ncbi:MAG: hypothetical protein ACM3O3_13000 [Syntrophothermus sp.]
MTKFVKVLFKNSKRNFITKLPDNIVLKFDNMIKKGFQWLQYEQQKAVKDIDKFPCYKDWLQVNNMVDSLVNFKMYIYIAKKLVNNKDYDYTIRYD